MGRIVGLITCSCLVIVAMRLTNLQHTDHTLKGGEDRASARAKLSPREHFKHGKDSFLRGRYQDAVQHLEAVTAIGTGLSGTERRQAEDYLTRARSRVQAATDGTVVRAQSDPFWVEEDADEPPAREPSSSLKDATRVRVDRLMTTAQAALQRGDVLEAKKLSQQAAQLSKDAKLTFGKGETNPANFLAKLSGGAATAAWTDNEFADKPASKGKAPKTDIRQIAAQREPTGFDEAAPSSDVAFNNPGRTAPSSGPAASDKKTADTLIAQARADLKAGRFDEARRKALQADELDLTYDLFEDRPELLLADVDRHSSTMTIARPNSSSPKAASPAVAIDDGNARNAKSSTTKTASASANPSNDSQKQQALKLLELARQDMKNGNLDGAQAKAEQAGQLNVAYKLFEDMPELVLNEVAARRVTEGLAQNAVVPNKTATPATRPQAKALLAKARSAMGEGRIDEARQLAIEADRLKAPYDLFDDRPDIVLADIARAAKRGPGVPAAGKFADDIKTTNVTPASNDDPFADPAPNAGSSPANVAANSPANARQNVTPAQAEALEKLRQARQLMSAGRFDEARAKAEEAEAMNVTFPVFADRPDLVVADLNKKMSGGNVASRKPVRDSGVTTADASNELVTDGDVNPFAPNTRSSNGRNGITTASGSTGRRPGNVMAADATTETDLSGSSAGDLYNRGMAELNRGNRAGAYSAFLAAYQSGQQLDRVRTQRMQDYLRELAPKANRKGNGIQLANNQVDDNDIAKTPDDGTPLSLEAPSVLDAAQQEQAVKFDRLRSDVLNAVFKAERLKDTDPEAALTLIDQTLAKVEGAELPEQAAVSLTRQLNKTRSSLQSEIVRQQPNLELKKRNEEVKRSLTTTVETNIRVEQEYAKLVEEFNELFKQQRFAEAEIVAKKAKEMNPKDPTAETLFWKAKFGRRVANNEKLKNDKEESFMGQLDDVEQAVIVKVNDKHPIDFGDNFKDITARRNGKYRTDNRTRDEDDIRIEQSLSKVISLHEEQSPLSDVIAKIAAVADINIVTDQLGLEEEGVSTNTPVTISVEGIKVKSALNLILGRHNLGYHIHNQVLNITSRIRQQGELVVATYPVADLVIPITNFGQSSANNPFGTNPLNNGIPNLGGAQMSVPPGGFPGMGQVGPGGANPLTGEATDGRSGSRPQAPDFNSLTELLTSTIAPDSWDSVGGQASVRHYETTLSLVIRQTQKVHEEIADLLDQLRRLQDLQVTIEVRFVTVTDRFFERIGIDFDFGLQSTLPGPDRDNTGLPIQPFGSIQQPQFGLSGTQAQQGQQQQGGQQQGQQGQAAAASSFFTQGPTRQMSNRSKYPGGTVLGMSAPGQFTSTTDVPFQQGSFEVGVPTFGGFNPKAGVEMGLAILSDVEAFFFIQAAQGDQRSNLMFAPKVTLFNGQLGHVESAVRRPFVISLIPTVGFFSTGFQPVIAVIPEGITLDVTAVVSADRRFVRLTVSPIFSNITDVFTFSFVGGSTGGGQQGQQGQQGQGGGQGGGQGQNGGQFGIGGGVGTMQIMSALFTQQQQGQQGQQGQQNQGGGGANLTVTVQQPVVEQVTVNTTVSVPDGGTVLLGGVKRLREGRNMSGVPILNKIPYVSRLFKNTGVGRETESLMLMVTPRIIIQEEEEELLGIPRT